MNATLVENNLFISHKISQCRDVKDFYENLNAILAQFIYGLRLVKEFDHEMRMVCFSASVSAAGGIFIDLRIYLGSRFQ